MRRRTGFTLIEVLAAVFLTAIVMTVAITFFIDLSNATDAAADKTRDGRHALAVLDRVARDLEGAYLVAKPAERDPLTHPWFFVARNEEGQPAADRVEFITRHHRPRNPYDHGSDIAVVTWLLQPAPDGPGYELLRAVVPGLPEGFEEFLSPQDERFMVVADGIEHFGMRFLAEELEWVDEWDSSQLERSGLLPRAAEIEISYLPELPDDVEDFDDFGRLDQADEGAYVYLRRIAIPMRPVDVDAMLQEVLAKAEREQQGRAGQDDELPLGADDLDPEELEELEQLRRGRGVGR